MHGQLDEAPHGQFDERERLRRLDHSLERPGKDLDAHREGEDQRPLGRLTSFPTRRRGGVEILDTAEHAGEDHDAAFRLGQQPRSPERVARLLATARRRRAWPRATLHSIW